MFSSFKVSVEEVIVLNCLKPSPSAFMADDDSLLSHRGPSCKHSDSIVDRMFYEPRMTAPWPILNTDGDEVVVIRTNLYDPRRGPQSKQ